MTSISTAERTSGVRWFHCLALAGGVLALWETWTVGAWLADGPAQITAFRDPDSLNWLAGKAYEAGALGMAIVVGIGVIRQCRREHRFTFDAMVYTVGLTMVWGTGGPNFFMPTYLFSSNLVNVNAACGHMPLVVNPECGALPDPIIMSLAGYGGGILLAMRGGTYVIGRLREKWPDIRTGTLVAALVAMGLVIHILTTAPSVALGLWTYPSTAWAYIPLGSGHRYSLFPALGGMFFYGLPALLYVRDDAGRNWLQRALAGVRHQTALTVLCLYAVTQLGLIAVNAPLAASGFYSKPWPELERYLVNDVCDAPGVSGTRYGPCPGSPGFRMPVRDLEDFDDEQEGSR